MDQLWVVFLCPLFLMLCCLVATCWERADLLAHVGDVYCIFVTFPCHRYRESDVVHDCIVS